MAELLDWSVLGDFRKLCGKLEEFVNFPCCKFLRSLQGSFTWAFSLELNLAEIDTHYTWLETRSITEYWGYAGWKFTNWRYLMIDGQI